MQIKTTAAITRRELKSQSLDSDDMVGAEDALRSRTPQQFPPVPLLRHDGDVGYLRSVSTSLNLNCPSAPPVSVWSTCVASANALTSPQTLHGLVPESHLNATAFTGTLRLPPKLTNSSQPPLDRLSQHPTTS